MAIQIGGPANVASTTQVEFYAMTVFDEKPRDMDLIKTLAYLEAQFGGPLWPSEIYG